MGSDRPTSSLADRYPEIAAQANGWDPTTVAPKSNRRREWRCEFGHVWEASPSTRVRGHNCPYCWGVLPIVGETDLATVNPELAAQAHGWDPTTVSYGSGRRLPWRCANGHVWNAVVVSRNNGRGCPHCAGRVINPGVNDLATVNPELASEAVGWDATTVSPMSHDVVEWRCSFGHSWRASIASRNRGSGCPQCHRESVKSPRSDLATEFPALASQAHGWDPTTVTSGSHQRLAWQCSLGHVWVAVVKNRTLLSTGCPYCAGRLPIVGENDLATVNPGLAAQAHGWDPTTVSLSSGRRREWKCELGHVWVAVVSSRQYSGCPVCSRRTNRKGPNGKDPLSR